MISANAVFKSRTVNCIYSVFNCDLTIFLVLIVVYSARWKASCFCDCTNDSSGVQGLAGKPPVIDVFQSKA